MKNAAKLAIVLLTIITIAGCSTPTSPEVFSSSLADKTLQNDVHRQIDRIERGLSLLPNDENGGGGIPVFGGAKIVNVQVIQPYNNGHWAEKWSVQRAQGFSDSFTVNYLIYFHEVQNGTDFTVKRSF